MHNDNNHPSQRHYQNSLGDIAVCKQAPPRRHRCTQRYDLTTSVRSDIDVHLIVP